jgi:ribosomal protein L11 methylase PrmA
MPEMSALLVVILLLVGGFMVAAISGAPWVPAFSDDLEAVLEDAGLKKNDLFLELGCGDGRLVVAAAKRGAVAVGYEINPIMWLIAKLRALHCPGAKIKFGNLWQVDLSEADVVLAFLVPRTVQKLEDKVVNEMKSGSILVSYIFKLPHLKPKLSRHHWFIYQR